MPPDNDETDAGQPRRPASPVSRYWRHGVDGLGAVGTVMILLLMIMICADVMARNLIGGSLPLISELGAFTVIMIVYLQLGTTIRNRRLASTDFFLIALGRRSPRAAAFVDGLWSLVGVAICAGIAWSTRHILERSIEHFEFIGVTGIMTMPTWPFRALILLGVSVATIQFLIQAVRSFQMASGHREPVE